MKKIFSYIFILSAFILFTSRVDALSVSKNSLTLEKGTSESVELYANTEVEVTKVELTLVYSTYDIPAAFVVTNGNTDSNPYAITHVITLPEAKSGKFLLGRIDINVVNNPKDTSGSVNIHTAKATTTEGNIITLNNQDINITVGTPKKEEPKVVDKNMLEKIESKIVDIELKKDVFEYTVSIDKDLEELDLKPIVKDSDTKVDITTQKISEIKDNKIIITTKNGDTEQKYTINLKEKEEVVVNVDKTEFKNNNSYKVKWIILSVILLLVLVGSLLSIKRK